MNQYNEYDETYRTKEDIKNSKQLRDHIRRGKVTFKTMSDLERQYLSGYVPSSQKKLKYENTTIGN
jgi:hypothetical protein